jgi:amino acid permease
MNQILHSIHALHQYAYLPIMLFLVAIIVILASLHSQNNRLRYTGYVVAVALVVSCVFII